MMTTLSVCAAAHTCSQPVDSGESRLSSHLLQSLLLIVKLFWFALSFICTLSSGYYTRADNIVSTNWFKAAYIMQWLATTPIVYNLGAKVVMVEVEEEEEEVEGQVTTTTSRQYTTTSSSELTSHWRYGWDYYYSVQWQCQWFSQSNVQNVTPGCLMMAAYGMGSRPVPPLHSTRTSVNRTSNIGLHRRPGCIGGWLLLLQWTRPSPGPTSPPGPCWSSSSRIQSRSPARISSGSGDTRGSWLTRTSSCWLAEHQEPSGIKNWSNALKHSDMIFSK